MTAKLTFLNTILLWSLVVWVLVLLCDALGALVEMVFVTDALGGAGAFC